MHPGTEAGWRQFYQQKGEAPTTIHLHAVPSCAQCDALLADANEALATADRRHAEDRDRLEFSSASAEDRSERDLAEREDDVRHDSHYHQESRPSRFVSASKCTVLHVQVRQLADPPGASYVRTAVAITNLSEERRNPVLIWQDLGLEPNVLEDGESVGYSYTATNVAAHGTEFMEHRAAVGRQTFPTTDKNILVDLFSAARWSPSGA